MVPSVAWSSFQDVRDNTLPLRANATICALIPMPHRATEGTHARTPFLERNHAWSLFSLALLLRLALFLFILIRFGDAGFIFPPFSDGHGYVTIAQNVLEGRGFSLETEAPFTPDTKRVPLYPLYLAATFALTGGAWWLAALLQTLMGAALVYLIYKVADSFAGRRAAFFSALFAATYPFAIFLSTQLLAETLFTFVLFGAFAFFVRTPAVAAYRHIVLGGLLMGLTTLVKPAAQYIPLLLVPFIALRQRGLLRLTHPIVYIFCFVLVISPWLARNNQVSGAPMLSFEANILLDLHVAGYKAFEATGAAGRFEEYRAVREPGALTSASHTEYMQRLLGVIFSDPIGFSKYLAISTVPFVLGDGFVTMVTALSPTQAIPAWNFSTSLSALARTIGFGILPLPLVLLSIATKGMWAIVLVSALWGFLRLVRSGGDKMVISLGMVLVIAYFMFAGGPVQSARYRQPVEPLIFLMAGIGVAEALRLLEIHRARRSRLPSPTN